MHSTFRALRPFARPIALSLLFLVAIPASGRDVRAAERAASAQKPAAKTAAHTPDPAPVSREAWLYKGSDITPDAAWHFGTLSNGLRFAVRRNGVPPGQVAIRVRIDAGSLMETDDERGFAHFIEHLTFRGSVYVADGEAKRLWQRLGTTFGTDTNAETTPTSTTYKLDLPSATAEGIDESLKVLSGMMAQPTLTTTAVTAERPVVLAEQREQPGPQVRLGDAVRQTFFAGQPLADRSPIGSVKTLEAATADSVKAFHDRWYRPDRTVVIISGDFDTDVIERLVARHFSGWIGIGPSPAEPDFGKPDPSQPPVRSIVEPSIPTLVSYAVVRPWVYRDDTVIFNQKRMVDQIAVRLLDRRLEQRARSGGSYLVASVGLQDISRSANATTVQIQPVGDDWEAALRDVRAVIADAQATPPTQAEIDRELAEVDSNYKNQVDTARAEAGADQADNFGQALDIRETIASQQVSYDILRDARAKGMFTPAAVLESSRRIFVGDATRAIVNTHAPDATVEARLAAALKADVSGLAVKRGTLKAITFAQLPSLGKPGKVVKETKLNGVGNGGLLERVDFANGVRLALYPNNGETNRVYVQVRFGGGYKALPADRATPAWAAGLAMVASGIGSFGQEELDQLTTGRQIGMGFSIDDDAFVFSGLTNPQDMADQLALIAAKLNTPGWDPNPVLRAKTAALSSFDSFQSSPSGVLARDLDGLLHGGDPRWTTPSREQVAATTPEAFRKFWEPLLRSGPIEVQLFGDFKRGDGVAAVAKTFGALAPRRADQRAAPPIGFPEQGKPPLVRTHDGPTNQAVAVLAWPTGGGLADIADSRRLSLIAQIITDRLYDRLRSEAGASYSPQVQSSWPVGLAKGGRVVAIGQVPPDKVDFFFQLVREIAADLVAKPIDDDELKRTLLPYFQYVSRSSTGNTFWLNQLEGASFDEARITAAKGLFTDIASIRADQLQQVAQKYLKPEAAWTFAVVPKAGASDAPAAAPKKAGPQLETR